MNILKHPCFQFFKSRLFLINLAAAILLIILLGWLTLVALETYTLHGQQINVPYLKGKPLDTVSKILNEKQLKYKVTDSSYVKNEPSLAVLDQNPNPNAKVKQNRTIYLIVNAQTPPKVKLPDLRDKSLRTAISKLKLLNLEVGRTIYQYSQFRDVVLDQKIEGKEAKPGTLVPKGTKVDLVVGRGTGSKQVNVPDVRGLPYNEARFVIKGASLNIGARISQGPIKDTAQAIVKKQRPAHNSKAYMGEEVDLYLAAPEDG